MGKVMCPSTRRLLLSSMALALASTAGTADGGVNATSVTAGVTISRPDTGSTRIVAPDNAIIGYSEFNIAGGELVQFVQPSADARVLNRIQSASPSVIDGTLSANGTVYLVNPAGVTFGEGAVVNVGSLYAAAGKISDGDFLSGVNRFTDLTGAVHNHGTIHAQSLVALIGRDVSHGGSILAPAGTVVMASGDSVLIGQIRGNVFVSIETGTQADAGAGGVEVSGHVQAAEVTLISGDIYSLAVSGWIDASSAQGEGGVITATGKTVELTGTLDASGATGGGVIHVGGEVQGTGDMPTAHRTYVGPQALLRAAATEAGDGGTVVVWADDATWYYGTIDASAGPNAGNGGFVEVSGKTFLAFEGAVDAGALAGTTGTILLDPANIVIVDGDSGADDTVVMGGEVLETVPGDTLSISEGALEGLGGNVRLEATNNITIEDLTDNELNLMNADSVTFAAGAGIFTAAPDDTISVPNGSLTITAGTESFLGNIQSSGDVILDVGAGSITLGDLAAGLVTVTGGDITYGSINSNDTVSLVSSIGGVQGGGITSDGMLTVQALGAGGTLGLGDVNTMGNAVTLTATDGLVALGDLAAGPVTVTGGDITYGSITSGGTVSLTSNMGVITRAAMASGDITSGGALDLMAVNGSIMVGDLAAGPVTVTGGDITYGSIDSGGAVSLTSNMGSITRAAMASGDITSGGTLDLTAATDISTGNIQTMGNDAMLSVVNGSIALGDITASSITMSAIMGGEIDEASWGDLVTAAGFTVEANNIRYGSIDSGGAVSLTSNMGSITRAAMASGDITSGGALDLMAVNGSIMVGDLAAGPVTVTGGDITYGSIDSGGAVSLTSNMGSITRAAMASGDITSGGTLDLTAATDISTGNIQTMGNDAMLSVVNGSIALGDITASSITMSAIMGGEIDEASWGDLVTAAGFTVEANNIRYGSIDSGDTVSLASVVGNIDGGDITSSGQLDLTAATDISAGNIQTMGNDAMLSVVNGSIALGDITASSITMSAIMGGEIDEASWGDLVTAAGFTVEANNIRYGSIDSGDTVSLASVVGNIDGGDITSSGQLDLTAATDISAGNIQTMGNDAMLSVVNGSIALGDITASSITMSAIMGGEIDEASWGDLVTAAGFTVEANNIRYGSIDSGDTVSLASVVGNIDGGDITSSGQLDLTAATDISAGNIQTMGNDAMLSVVNGSIALGDITASSITMSAIMGGEIDEASWGDLVTAAGFTVEANNIRYGSIDSGDTVSLASVVGNIDGGDITSSGQLDLMAATDISAGNLEAMGNDATLTALGSIMVGDLAAGPVTVTGGDITYGSINSGDTVSLASVVGNIDGGDITSSGQLDLTAATDISAGNIQTMGNDAMLSVVNGSIALGDITASSITMSAIMGGEIDEASWGDLVTAAGFTVEANNIRYGSIDSGDTVSLASVVGNIDGGDITSSGQLDLTAATDISAGNIQTMGNDAMLSVVNGSIALGDITASSITMSAIMGGEIDEASWGDLVTAAGFTVEANNIRYGSIDSGDTVSLASVVGNIDGGDITSSGQLDLTAATDISAGNIQTMGNDAMLSVVNGSIALGDITASSITMSAIMGGEIDEASWGDLVTAAGFTVEANNIRYGSIDSGDTVSLASVVGNIDGGDITSSGQLDLTAATDISAGNLEAMGNIELKTPGDIDLGGGDEGIRFATTIDSNGGGILITTGQTVFSGKSTIKKITMGDLLFFTRGGDLTIDPFKAVSIAEGSLVFDAVTAAVVGNGNGNISFGQIEVPMGSFFVNTRGDTTITECRHGGDAITINVRAVEENGAGTRLVAGDPFTSGFNGELITEVDGVRIDADQIRIFSDGILVENEDIRIDVDRVTFNRPDGSRAIVAHDLGRILDPRGQVIINTNTGLIASLLQVPRNQLISFPPTTRELILSQADLDILQKFVPGARELRPGERIETTQGRAIYNDTLHRAHGITSLDYNIAVTRMEPAAVVAALDVYRSVLVAGEESRASEIRGQLAKATIVYINAGHAVDGDRYDPAAFRRFLAEEPSNAGLVADLDQLAQLLNQIDRMGLNEVEEENSYHEILTDLTPSDLSLEQTRALIMASAEMPGAPGQALPADGQEEPETAARSSEDGTVVAVSAR